MKYLLTIYSDESGWEDVTPEQGQEIMNAYWAFQQEVEQAGVFIAGEGLEPTSAATSVRVRDGERLVTDGPFAETKEALGGFYLLECENLDDALEWAAKIPSASWGTVEVRPVMDYDAVSGGSTAGEAQRAS